MWNRRKRRGCFDIDIAEEAQARVSRCSVKLVRAILGEIVCQVASSREELGVP